MQLDGRIALVTGAGRRVGKVIAIGLAARGMRVAVHYHGSDEGAQSTVAEIGGKGGEARAFGADLTERHAPARLIRDVTAHFGALDALINSAAIMKRTPLDAVDTDSWDAMFALNLRAPFFLVQAAAPALRERGGAIVNIADLAAFETWPGYIPHSLTKVGIVHMTRGLARVLAPEVRVNAVAPGVVLPPDDFGGDETEALRESTPLERLGAPEDVERTVAFLLEEDFITGETIIVDGGRHVRR